MTRRRKIALGLGGAAAAGALTIGVVMLTTEDAEEPTGAGTCAGLAADKTGTNGADTIHGTNQVDIIQGSGGDDKIYGHDGGDVLCGGDDADRIEGNAGGDELFGSPGADRHFGGVHDDYLNGGPGVNDFGDGGDGLDECVEIEETTSCF